MGNLLNRFYQTKEEEKMDCVSRPESHDEDTISELPNEILLHILSYLASKDILKTFALSTRRRYQDISIASARLQRLTIEGFVPHYSYSSLEIECPNLQSLNISNWCWCCGEVIQVCDLYSLVEANIDIDCEHYLRDLPDRWTTNSPIPELIERFRHVKSLQLSSSTLQFIGIKELM
ncbi:hypothetical protein COLO4_28981 [Corchorus olitorius]|uniref:F-box domain-containing protein n=1 Tax=Corchorus olitorius TaxID=93759 RepID=A0A1R3HH70_9ROSI|nr:hypothetical protein COLO4_28981 [Corchorus olitorius]